MEYKLEADSIATTDVNIKTETNVLFTNVDFACVKCNLCGKVFPKGNRFTVTFQNKNYFYICWECTYSKLNTVIDKVII